MPLDATQIRALYAEKDAATQHSANSSSNSWIEREIATGILTVKHGKRPSPNSLNGPANLHFEGKQGTVKRSPKGASRIQPNGYRRLSRDYAATHEVVMY